MIEYEMGIQHCIQALDTSKEMKKCFTYMKSSSFLLFIERKYYTYEARCSYFPSKCKFVFINAKMRDDINI